MSTMYYGEEDTKIDFSINKVVSFMLMLGFDFSSSGSIYLYRMVRLMLMEPENFTISYKQLSQNVSKRYNQKIKTVNRAVRWAIEKAVKSGDLAKLPFYREGQMPKSKDVVVWIYSHIVELKAAQLNRPLFKDLDLFKPSAPVNLPWDKASKNNN